MPRIIKSDELPPSYARADLFTDHGPIHPAVTADVLRTLIRSLPMEGGERLLYRNRRIISATRAIEAIQPRDEIEMMLAEQAVLAHHHALARWHASTRKGLSEAESLRQISAAAAATRMFDSMLRAVERRQARPMAEPPVSQDWSNIDLDATIQGFAAFVIAPEAGETVPDAAVLWEDAAVEQVRAEIADAEEEDAPTNVEGVNPDGSMTVPDNPTDEQKRYMARRIARNMKDPALNPPHPDGRHRIIKPLRAGDWLP